MDAFSTALAPVLAIILLGFILKRIRFLPAEAWAGMEKLTYYVLLPALLVHTLANQTLAGTPWPSMLLVLVITILLSALVIILFYRLRPGTGPATFTSIFQGGVRFNSYIALSVALGLFGEQGLALSSVAVGFMIVLINLLVISAFVVSGKSGVGIGMFVRAVLANPLIIGCAIGWLLNLSGVGLPGISQDIFEITRRAALPFGLLAVGAALKPEAVRGHVRSITVSSLVQFVLKPFSAAWLASLVGLSGVPASVLIIAFMTPTATSSYILARQLAGDAETMVSIITFQTLLAFVAMPLLALILLV